MDGINGVFFTGGSLNLCDMMGNYSPYMVTAKRVWDYAIKHNQADDHFPLWATCQGFQAFHILAADDCRALGSSKSTNHNARLLFQPEAIRSRLFRRFPLQVLKANQDYPLTYNMHQLGIHPEAYSKFPALADFFDVLTTSYDQNQLLTVSTIQAKVFPFYATQYHPERPLVDFNKDWLASHELPALLFSQEMARFFLHEARKCAHRMPHREYARYYELARFPCVWKEEGPQPIYSMGKHFTETWMVPNNTQ